MMNTNTLPSLQCLPCAYTASGTKHRLDEPWWQQRHEKILDQLDPATEIVFIGDSITQGWEEDGAAIFAENFSDWKTLNLGFCSDHTHHVLWRLRNGELKGLNPKVVILLIGTNNTGREALQAASETSAGIVDIVSEVHAQCPDCKVLLLAILPRNTNPEEAPRRRNDEINRLVSTLPESMPFVTYKNLNHLFLEADGRLRKDLMPDLLHPSEQGYQIWAEALIPILEKLL
jgi:lysophospholipase L1-like esterase